MVLVAVVILIGCGASCAGVCSAAASAAAAARKGGCGCAVSAGNSGGSVVVAEVVMAQWGIMPQWMESIASNILCSIWLYQY